MDGSPVSPAVMSFDPVEWTKKIEALEAMVSRLQFDNRRLDGLREEARIQAASASGELMAKRLRVQRLEKELADSENLKELARLRTEVALLHAAIDKSNVALAGTVETILTARNRATAAEARFKALESTAALLQAGRDAAAKREAQAFQRVAELDRDLATTVFERDALRRDAGERERMILGVAVAHEKGHPQAVEGCAICSALGRKVEAVKV